MLMPGGETHDFWEAVETTSMPQASTEIGAPPALLTASTKTRASEFWWTTFAMSCRGLVVPVELSLWVNSTALQSGMSGQSLGDRVRVGGLAERKFEPGYVGAVRLGDLGEALPEHADDEGQHLVAGRQRVYDGRLHTACT